MNNTISFRQYMCYIKSVKYWTCKNKLSINIKKQVIYKEEENGDSLAPEARHIGGGVSRGSTRQPQLTAASSRRVLPLARPNFGRGTRRQKAGSLHG
jgi:hypothetical protein